MFKVMVGNHGYSTFKTWKACREYQKLLASHSKQFTVYEWIDNDWVLID